MGKMQALVSELVTLLEDSAPGVGTGTAPSASGIPAGGGAPPGGAPSSLYMGGSFPMPGTDQPSGMHACAGCGTKLYGPGPCPGCFPYGPPARALGGLARGMRLKPWRKKSKKGKKKHAKKAKK